MLNSSKRILTSIPLFIILYMAIQNRFLLFSLFVFISIVSLIEIFKIIKKIFKKNRFKILLIFLISITYLSIFISQLYFFIGDDLKNKIIFIFLIAICIATDMGGYFFGKIFKGKKLTSISPNKTYSGLFGSYFFSLCVFIFFFLQLDFNFNFIILTFVVSTISQIGDLFISYLKRKAKVKDTGILLPGHGGILDRIDGIIFAVPISINLTFLF